MGYTSSTVRLQEYVMRIKTTSRGERKREAQSEGETVVDDASRSDGQSSGVKDAVCSWWTWWDTHTAVCFPAMLG